MKLIFKIIALIFFNHFSFGQSIDKIVATVGDEILLKSEIEAQYLQYLTQGNESSSEIRCNVVEDLLFQKLLINQAKLDSLEVTSDQVMSEVNNRIKYFENQLGSVEKLEEYFNKSLNEIESEIKNIVKEQLYAQKMQAKIVEDVKVTPQEAKTFYASLDNSLKPLVPTQIEVSQIVIKPVISDSQKNEIRKQLNGFRDRVNKGENFNVLATLYSDDQGSAVKGGELGFVNRGDLVPEFERAAFRLKEGEVSEIVESQFGLHIIQLISRRGDQINVRHILKTVKPNSKAIQDANKRATELYHKLISKEISFEQAIIEYSDDESKNNSGLILDPNSMSSLINFDNISSDFKIVVNDMQEGDISKPVIINFSDNKDLFRIIKINKRIESHIANVVDDFNYVKELTINNKKEKITLEWVNNKINKTYINLNENLLECNFRNNWKK